MGNQHSCETTKQSHAPNQPNEPRSVALARNGIKTDSEYFNLMWALMTDLRDGVVTASGANKITKAAASQSR